MYIVPRIEVREAEDIIDFATTMDSDMNLYFEEKNELLEDVPNRKNDCGAVFYPVRADLDYIPMNGFYRYKTNPTMIGEWIIAGEMKVLRILSDVEVKEICDEVGSAYLPREHEIDLREYGFAA